MFPLYLSVHCFICCFNVVHRQMPCLAHFRLCYLSTYINVLFLHMHIYENNVYTKVCFFLRLLKFNLLFNVGQFLVRKSEERCQAHGKNFPLCEGTSFHTICNIHTYIYVYVNVYVWEQLLWLRNATCLIALDRQFEHFDK